MEFFTWKFVLVWSRVNKVKDARSNAGKGKTNMSCVGCGLKSMNITVMGTGREVGFSGRKKKEHKKNMVDAIC